MADGTSSETKKPGTPKLNAALREAQKLFKPIEKGAINPAFKDAKNPAKANGTPYADLEDVVEATRPILLQHGIAVSQEPMPSNKDGHVCVRTVLLHESGEERSGTVELPCVQKTPQAYGAAISYAKRYGWQALTGAVAKGEDDDGNASSGRTETTHRRNEPRASEVSASKPPPGAPRPAPKPSSGPQGNLPTHFGNFGNAKGQAIQGQDEKTLRYYMHACERTLADQSKLRFHDKEKLMLAAIQAEIERQSVADHSSSGSSSDNEPPPHTDDDRQF